MSTREEWPAAELEGEATPGEDPSAAAASPERDGPNLPRAAQVGRYIVLERLGVGGAGVVYSAYDPSLDRKVALKLLHSAGAREPRSAARREARLLTEAKTVARLSHPNVVSIHDVGSYGGRVFIAMEYLSGGTLRGWLESRPRTQQEIVQAFIGVGRGLAAAHAAGIIHRDFKPDNVLFDGNGSPKVADFGVARLFGDAVDAGPPDIAALSVPVAVGGGRPPLTDPGALVGTPAYMAPEQYMGRIPDAQADQFAFCVSLYEALYGERPFRGETLLALAASIATGDRRPTPAGSRVPAWLQRAVLRGLATAPGERHPSMQAMVHVLSNDARLRRRWRMTVLAALGVALASVVGSLGNLAWRRHTFERAVTARIAEAGAEIAQADGKRRALGTLRAAALDAFDRGGPAEPAEAAWREASDATQAVRALYAHSMQTAESALLTDSRRTEARELVADALLGRALLDLDADLEVTPEDIDRLALYDVGGTRRAQLARPARLTLSTRSPDARVDIERLVRAPGEAGRYEVLGHGLSAAAVVDRPLPPGSYRLTVTAAGKAPVRVPLLLRPNTQPRIDVSPPPAARVPADFVVVMPGDFLTGSAVDDLFRRDLFHAAPLHTVRGAGFLVKRHETTFREWIAYLDTLPERERTLRAPKAASMGFQGDLDLRREADGRWRLRIQPSTRAWVVTAGELIRNSARQRFEAQDWLELPVAGVSSEDAAGYAAWLRASGRIPTARLCTEEEWEHAARGADGRPFPHGWSLRPGEANYSATWGNDAPRYGPVVVGSFPQSESPYGVLDMAGNVWEWVRPRNGVTGQLTRGGAFPFDLVAQRCEVREPVEASVRNITIGVRLCADFPD